MLDCKLDEYLNKTNLSITAFCNELHISRTYYYDICKASKMPTIDLCFRICTVLSCELNKDISIYDIWKRNYN